MPGTSLQRLGRTLLLAAAASTVLLAPPTVATARQNGGRYVNVNFCNQTSGKIYLALSYLNAPGSHDWVVEGWKNIAGNSCMAFDLPSTGWFYYYAEDDSDGYWGASDIQICVEHPGPFHRINTDGYTCASSELKGFRGVDPGNNATFTVNIKP